MYELKNIGKVFTSKFVGTGPSSYKKRIYQAAVSQRFRNTALKRAASGTGLHLSRLIINYNIFRKSDNKKPRCVFFS